jgi:autotransporter strand-loop-strand O-heptosyltransferase
MKPKVYAHCSYIGTTGFNNHSRDFFRELSKHCELKIRNFTVGDSWNGYSVTCHDGENYLTDLDRKLLYKQLLWVRDGVMEDFNLYPSEEKEFKHDINIVLNETHHHLFYRQLVGPKIAYNVWESTLQPQVFFDKLKEFDELWVPSKWQRDCTIAQGYDPDKIKVVPEGVDVDTFFPEKVEPLDDYKDGRFKFILFGRWDYRKSTKEIIETFLKTFSPDEPVDLIVSIDNMWGEEMDGFKTTEERLSNYGLTDPRIKIVHFPSREDYIKYIKTGHVFVSCARSEGWNLPLIEAMACGTPSIYSNCTAQLEFAENKGLPVEILGRKKASENYYGKYEISETPGDYYEPDFDDLSRVMRYAYENYDSVKRDALEDSEKIRNDFNWERIGEVGAQAVNDFIKKINSEEYLKNKQKNSVNISFIDGPKVEIIGDTLKNYFIEFLDEHNEVVYSNTISNGMWTSCSRKYYTEWKIRIDGEIVHEMDLENQTVFISFESASIGDTIAWAPYVVDFQNKHKCNIILSTFHNDWFEGHEAYKDIKFVKPGSSEICYAMYRIGYFKSDDGSWTRFDAYPNQVNLIPLQKVATDILGLDYYEMNYGINYKVQPRPIKQKYIVLGPQSTAGCKEWVYDNWVELSNYLIDKGYKVVILSSNPYKIENVLNIYGKGWNEVLNYMFHSEFFIGLSSGLAWLNWSLGKKSVMIAGFSEAYNEFTHNNIRISNDKCIKCWNDPVLKFDAGDWDWCPVYKGTKLQHICQKSITVKQVIEKLPL